MKKIFFLFVSAVIALHSAAVLSAKDTSVISLDSYDKESINVTSQECDAVFKNQENQIQAVLSDVFSEKYGEQTVYVGSGFQIYNEIIYMGGKYADYFFPVFSEDGALIGVLEFARNFLFNPQSPKEKGTPVILIRCSALGHEAYFPVAEAVAFLEKNPGNDYLFCAIGGGGDYYGILDSSNRFEIVKSAETPSPETCTDNLSFKELRKEHPEAVISFDTFVLQKDTAKAFSLIKSMNITLGAGIEDPLP